MVVKSSWEKEIEKDMQDRRLSLKYAIENDSIEKGVVSDILYSDSELKFANVKGNDLKKRFEHEKHELGERMIELGVKVKALQDAIKEEPKEEMQDIKVYSYSQIYKEDGSDSEKSAFMRKHNDFAYRLASVKKECKSLDVLISNVKENKEYKLSIDIVAQLGL